MHVSEALFFAPGASSLAAHILLREAEIPFTLERVDLIAKLWSGGHYDQINPKLYVPALMLPSGDVLTEGNIILQYISDHAPSKHLLPANHELDRYRALEWLNFIGMEIHKISLHASVTVASPQIFSQRHAMDKRLPVSWSRRGSRKSRVTLKPSHFFSAIISRHPTHIFLSC